MEKAKYGNWVSERMLTVLWAASGITLAVTAASKNRTGKKALKVGAAATIGFSAYMQLCHRAFSDEGGKVMNKVHYYLLDRLEWDGKGDLLDIGCGSGALSIKCAKKFTEAHITGVDFWGMEWNYGKKQCENNAKAENVSDRVEFQKGDAASLDFDDESFDAAVSNFVFHEVKTAHDKRDVVREALRVVKKGGCFAFHDMFENKKIYGDINEFISVLKAEGISEIKYIPHTENESFIPMYLRTPWMLGSMGIIYGIK